MSLFRRIFSTFSSDKLDQEIKEEMRAHMEMRAEDNLAAGMPAEVARAEAARDSVTRSYSMSERAPRAWRYGWRRCCKTRVMG